MKNSNTLCVNGLEDMIMMFDLLWTWYNTQKLCTRCCELKEATKALGMTSFGG